MVKERRWNLGFLGKEKYPNSLCSLALAWFLLSAFSSAFPRGVCPSSRTLAFSFLVAQMVKNLPAMRDPWVGKIPWRREWLSTSVFLPGECWGLRSLAGHKSIGSHRAKPDWAPKPFSFQPHPAGRGDESHSRCRAHWLRFPLPPKLLGSAASRAAPSPLQSGLVFRTGSLSVSFMCIRQLPCLVDSSSSKQMLHPVPALLEPEPWRFSPNHSWGWLLPSCPHNCSGRSSRIMALVCWLQEPKSPASVLLFTGV